MSPPHWRKRPVYSVTHVTPLARKGRCTASPTSPHWRDKAGVQRDPRHPTGAIRPVYSGTIPPPAAVRRRSTRCSRCTPGDPLQHKTPPLHQPMDGVQRETPAGGSTPSPTPAQGVYSENPRQASELTIAPNHPPEVRRTAYRQRETRETKIFSPHKSQQKSIKQENISENGPSAMRK
jgi:hypothetical protein